VREKAVYRKLISVGTEMVSQGYDDSNDVEDSIDYAERALFELGNNKTKNQLTKVVRILPECFNAIEKAYELKRPITGTTSGFRELDDKTAGFQDSDLIIIAGRPSMGKTAIALNIARNIADKDLSVAIFSLEMSKDQLTTRMLCSDAKVDSSRVRNGRLDEHDHRKLVAAAGHLGECSIYIDDTPAITISEIRSKCRRLKTSNDLDIVIVDYLQLMRGTNKRGEREQEISSITRSLKALAKELNVPVIALSQLNRNLESRPDKRPKLSDLRESGAIEQDADLICFVYRDEVYNKDTKDKGIAELIIGKQRNGPIGTVRLNFIKKYTKFEEIQKQEDWCDGDG
jgi:replicative DNA helicase